MRCGGAECQRAPAAFFQLESNDPAVLKFRDVLVSLVHEMSVLDLQGTKHPHQDVHEVQNCVNNGPPSWSMVPRHDPGV